MQELPEILKSYIYAYFYVYTNLIRKKHGAEWIWIKPISSSRILNRNNDRTSKWKNIKERMRATEGFLRNLISDIEVYKKDHIHTHLVKFII
jgi:hypothetical protein